MSGEFSLSELGDGLDAAVSERHLPDPRNLEFLVNPNHADSASYLKAVSQRLGDLGFLAKEGAGKEQVDQRLEAAVRRFQACAGLEVKDGWAGPKTWRILNLLYSYENEASLDQWTQIWAEYSQAPLDDLNLSSNEAVLRAVYLRLYSLGFLPYSATLKRTTKLALPENPDFRQALADFSDFCLDAGLSAAAPAPYINRVLVNLLYQYDDMVKAIAAPSVWAALQEKYRHNLEAIARIELWLTGYDTYPGPDREIRIRVRHGPRGNRWIKTTYMKRAIDHFWKDHRQQPDGASDDAISLQLFRLFVSDLAEPDKSNQVGKQLDRHLDRALSSKRNRHKLETQFRRIASSIWDGLRRVTRWLFRMLRRAVTRTVDYFANLARYLSRKSRECFATISRAVDIVSDGMLYLKGSISECSRQGGVAFSQQRDFDQHCIMQPGTDGVELVAAFRHYRHTSRVYGASTRIVRHVVRIGRLVIRSLSVPVAGWLYALLTLVRVANSVRAIAEEVRLIRQLSHT